MSSEKETDKQPQGAEEENKTAETAQEAEATEEKKAPAKAKPAAKAAAEKKEAAADSESAEKPAKPVPAKAAAAKADAPKKEEPPPPPEPGKFGQLLIANGFHPVALGNDNGGMEMVEIKAHELLEACRFLKKSSASQFDLLVSVSGVDWKDRLEAVYHLYSTKTFERLAIKATAVDEKLPSVVSIWQGADWHERETYDLFGIVFEGHPNLKRILMPVDWVGHPMRKDYTVDDPRLVWNER